MVYPNIQELSPPLCHTTQGFDTRRCGRGPLYGVLQYLVRHYCRAQLSVCPSLYEGFGLPVAEAMACGLPVVATSGGALPEVVEDGVTGILVPPADARALAEATDSLMRDAQLRRRMGQAGRQRILEKFSWRKAALQTEAVYQQVCQPSPAAVSKPVAAS